MRRKNRPVSAINVTRNTGQGHSCTYPRAGAGGEAMCVSAKNSSSFNNNDDGDMIEQSDFYENLLKVITPKNIT